MKEIVITLERVSGTTFQSNDGRRYLLGNAFAKDQLLRVWQSTLDSLLQQRMAVEVTHES